MLKRTAAGQAPTRERLLFRSQGTDGVHERRNRLIARLIAERPDHDICELPLILPSMGDFAFWRECLSLWAGQMEARRNDSVVLGNAARFASLCDFNTSVDWFTRCKGVDGANPVWPHQLGLLYLREQKRRGASAGHEGLSVMAISELEQALSLSNEAGERSMIELDLMTALFDIRRYAEACSHATSLIEGSRACPDPWQRGLSVFKGNTILGLVSFAEGDAVKARDHLLASVTPLDEQTYCFLLPKVFEIPLAVVARMQGFPVCSGDGHRDAAL